MTMMKRVALQSRYAVLALMIAAGMAANASMPTAKPKTKHLMKPTTGYCEYEPNACKSRKPPECWECHG